MCSCDCFGFYHVSDRKAFISNILYVCPHATVLCGQFIQPSGSLATHVMTYALPRSCASWMPAVAHYLRQNLLIFLHVPKYTDSNTAHHFKVQADVYCSFFILHMMMHHSHPRILGRIPANQGKVHKSS